MTAGRDTAAQEALALARAARINPADLVLVDGFHAVKHALRFAADLPVIAASDRAAALALALDLAPDILDTLERRLVEVPRGRLADAVGRVHPTGLHAVARRPRQNSHAAYSVDPRRRSARTGPAVLLDDPRHEGNLGAVIRVAAAANASAVFVLPGTADAPRLDPWSRGVVRGSAGLHWALPVLAIGSVDEVEGPLWALDPDGPAGTAVQDGPSGPGRAPTVPVDAVLCLGSERGGISAGVRSRIDGTIRIPMRPGVSSLNVATAAAAALYGAGVCPGSFAATRSGVASRSGVTL